MNFFYATYNYLAWMRSLLKKTSLVAPLCLLLTIFLFTISQFAAFLAFFLPLKVLYLVGSTGIPSYMKLIVNLDSKDAAIVLFALASVVCYCLHLLAQQLLDKSTQIGAQKLLDRSQKLTLFEHQDKLAQAFFDRFSRCFANIILVSGGFGLGFYLNDSLFLAVLGLIVLEYFCFALAWQVYSQPHRAKAGMKFMNKLDSIFKWCSSLNFFVGFSILIYVGLKAESFSVLIGFLNFMLLRRVLMHTVMVAKDVTFFQKNKNKINALFYLGTHYIPSETFQEKCFSDVIQLGNRSAWLNECVQSLGLESEEHWWWYDIGVPNAALFGAIEKDSDRQLYVKIYRSNPKLLRRQEKLLFTSLGDACSLMPLLIADFQHRGLYVCVFKGPKVRNTILYPKRAARYQRKASIIMWSEVTPSPRFVSQYTRSKPLLYDRLTENKIDQMLTATSSKEDTKAISDLKTALPAIRNVLSSLPLVIENPYLKQTMFITKDNQPLVFSWAKWSLETFGGNLNPHITPEKVQNQLTQLTEKRKCFASVTPEQALLMLRCTQLEKAIDLHKFNGALTIIPKILEEICACAKDSPKLQELLEKKNESEKAENSTSEDKPMVTTKDMALTNTVSQQPKAKS